MRITRFAALLSLTLTSPVAGQDTNQARAFVDSMVVAIRARDVDRWSTMFAPDAVMYPAAGTIVEGREAIRAFWTRAFAGATGANPLQVTMDEVVLTNDGAMVRARYGPDGGAIVGHYLFRLTRRERTWMVSWWMFTRRPPTQGGFAP